MSNNKQIEVDVTALLSRMNLAQKIGQMTQVEKNSITPAEVAAFNIGSVLSGGGGNPTPNNMDTWAAMVAEYRQAALETEAAIPLLYGVDAVHGHNNVYGAVIFPHNIGLGASRDADLVRRIARETAAALLATHVQWNFAPTVAVPQDIRWGRTYEGYSQDVQLVSKLGAAYIAGLQNEPDGLASAGAVLASAKHFVGDGATKWGPAALYPWIREQWEGGSPGWPIDQGDCDLDEATLRAEHLPPYQAAIAAGARNIMVSYSSWRGKKSHADHYLLTELLKGELGFSGFLVSDWMAIDQISSDYYECVVQSINAGLDMIMVPFQYRRFIDTVTKAVGRRDISQARIDDAVRRILRVKFELNLFAKAQDNHPYRPLFGGAERRRLAREAVQKSLVLLKNEGDALPLTGAEAALYVAGQAADDIGLQCGGWTIEWMGAAGAITPGTTLLAALQEALADRATLIYHPEADFDSGAPPASTAIVVLHEEPYAEGTGDRADLTLSPDQLALIKRARACCRQLILILYSGRPLILGAAAQLADTIIAAWLPGTEGAGIADLLLGKAPFQGKLPYDWPVHMDQIPRSQLIVAGEKPLWPLGHGLGLPEKAT